MRWRLVITAALLLAACDQARSPGPGPKPTARQPVVDPKSSAAAEELVRSFERLIDEGRFEDAYMLLGPGAPPRRHFITAFDRYSHRSVTVGDAHDQEGAAGSIYVEVPLTITGQINGKNATGHAAAVLRRVNDVPGSTEAQRHWHIERIDWHDS